MILLILLSMCHNICSKSTVYIHNTFGLMQCQYVDFFLNYSILNSIWLKKQSLGCLNAMSINPQLVSLDLCLGRLGTLIGCFLRHANLYFNVLFPDLFCYVYNTLFMAMQRFIGEGASEGTWSLGMVYGDSSRQRRILP